MAEIINNWGGGVRYQVTPKDVQNGLTFGALAKKHHTTAKKIIEANLVQRRSDGRYYLADLAGRTLTIPASSSYTRPHQDKSSSRMARFFTANTNSDEITSNGRHHSKESIDDICYENSKFLSSNQIEGNPLDRLCEARELKLSRRAELYGALSNLEDESEKVGSEDERYFKPKIKRLNLNIKKLNQRIRTELHKKF